MKTIHFIGIGGTGMSPVAQVLLEAGYQVQGSDLRTSPIVERLVSNGAKVFGGHDAQNVVGAQLIVISSAIPSDNPELQSARALNIPIVKRAELWGELMRRQSTIAVAGTHGKTTTSAMIAAVLSFAGLDPTILIGSELVDTGSSARLGRGRYLVAEADEFDGSFLKFVPWTAVITNIEPDHLDYFGSLEAIVAAFRQFLMLLPEEGHAVICWDDPVVRTLNLGDGINVMRYGFARDAEWRAANILPNAFGGNDFDLFHGEKELIRVQLALPGRHNVSNALAALAIAGMLEIPWARAVEGLASFHGTKRRLELRGIAKEILVYDDYAHHPTEVRATLSAIREHNKGRLFVLFQPHTYHRTKQFLPEFAAAFDQADRVLVADIYLPPGREQDTLGISARDLVKVMSHPGSSYAGSLRSAVLLLLEELRPGDLLVTMGAGDVTTVPDTLLAQLGKT